MAEFSPPRSGEDANRSGARIPSWARVGAQVVCIDDDWGPYLDLFGVVRVPMRKEVLTIAEAVWEPARSHAVPEVPAIAHCPAGVVLTFAEIPQRQGRVDVGWPIGHFRPLVRVTQEQDVEMFLRLVARTTAGIFDEVADATSSFRGQRRGAFSSLLFAEHRIPAGALQAPDAGQLAAEAGGSVAIASAASFSSPRSGLRPTALGARPDFAVSRADCISAPESRADSGGRFLTPCPPRSRAIAAADWA